MQLNLKEKKKKEALFSNLLLLKVGDMIQIFEKQFLQLKIILKLKPF